MTSASSVAIQSDGKIVAAGGTNNGSNYDFADSRATTVTGALTPRSAETVIFRPPILAARMTFRDLWPSSLMAR